jgi:ribosomal protein S18 acetylase RimI-like enzyme
MTPEALAKLMRATWPPAHEWVKGSVTFRDGAGGGKRVSAATIDGPFTEADLAALFEMPEPLVLIQPKDQSVDSVLKAYGWDKVDPVVAYAAPVAALAAELPALAAFPHWPPLAVAASIWEEGGIGPARLAVMNRVGVAKTALLARHGDRPAGVAFAAVAGTEAMVHALEVRPAFRRLGVGVTLMRAAANWAADQGAERLTVVVTERNDAARALYARLGMQVVGQYHYRVK